MQMCVEYSGILFQLILSPKGHKNLAALKEAAALEGFLK